MLAVGLPLILMVGALLMAMLLSRVLHPVSRMADTINRITATNLKLRVPMPPGNDELAYLATTFNGMLDRLDQSFSIQSRLVTDLSHQLRTPLAVLRGTLETGLRRVRSSSEYDEILSSNLEEVERIGRLIDGMLLLARIDSHSAELERGQVNLEALLRTLTEDLWPLWDQKALRVSLEGECQDSISGDERRLRQVFLSLLDNAWKYSPEGGTIAIRIRAGAGFQTVSLRNEGTPIPDGDLEHIFERFWRSKAALSAEGFGLGLAIARGIVELHGGRLWAENAADGSVVFNAMLPS
jgi:heavy metal sensor kinase